VGPLSPPSIVVVGGGLAGVAAALGACDGGAQVTLLERRGRLGGLTWSFRRQGRWFDNGQHVFLRCCHHYRALLERIGSAASVRLQDRLSLPVLAPGGRRADLERVGLPAPLHLAPSLARYRHLGVVDRVRLARPALALRRLDLSDPVLDQVTLGSWLASKGQASRAVERLWNLIALATLNVRADEASLALGAMVLRTGLLDHADAGDIGWSAVPLGVLHGERAAAALADSGVTVELGSPVQRVEAVAGGRWSVTTGTRRLEADAVVVATAPDTAQGLLGVDVLGGVTELGASPIVNVHLVFDRRVTDLELFAAVDSPVQFVFDRTEAAHFGGPVPTDEQCLSLSLSGADADIGRRPDALISAYVVALSELLPAVRSARLLDAVVTRERAATFRGVPGTAALRPGPVTRLDRVFVAGAWCATGWPATMEGAVRSGAAAAAAALERLGASPLPELARVGR
jgi:squalene-associated FAD-dependent desaturase